MPRRLPEKTQGFLAFVPQMKLAERLKVKIVSVERTFAIAEKLNQDGRKNSEN